MKRPLEEAAELFRENETRAGDDHERANLYRGLSLLAEGLNRLEKRLSDVETEIQDGPSHFYLRRQARLIRRLEQAVPPVPAR